MEARGVPRSTARRWYRTRAENGHPETAGQIGRADYWFEDEWTAWRERHEQGRLAELTEVDRGGDPDELVNATEAARILGYSNRDVVHANRRLGYFPDPDSYERVPTGRPSPRWKRSTVWAVADGRVGQGGTREPRSGRGKVKAHPYEGDKRLDEVLRLLRSGREPSATALAASWGSSRRTAERILRAARDFG
jgi:hypothetical protein